MLIIRLNNNKIIIKRKNQKNKKNKKKKIKIFSIFCQNNEICAIFK